MFSAEFPTYGYGCTNWMANTTLTNIYQNLWSCGHVILTHTHIEPIYFHYVSLFCCISVLKIRSICWFESPFLFQLSQFYQSLHWSFRENLQETSIFDAENAWFPVSMFPLTNPLHRQFQDPQWFYEGTLTRTSSLAFRIISSLISAELCRLWPPGWTLEMFEEVCFGYNNHSTLITTNHTKEVCVFIRLYSCLDICYYYNLTPWNISLPIYKYVYLYL